MKKRKRIFTLATFPVENKIVFVRVDYNVPLAEAKTRHKRKSSIKVKENTKIKASLPTIKYLLQKNCKIILATHLGRPEGKYVQELKVDPLAEELKKLLPNEKITKLPDCIGKEIQEKIANAKPKQIFLLENLRFYKEEEQNNPETVQLVNNDKIAEMQAKVDELNDKYLRLYSEFDNFPKHTTKQKI